MEAIDSVGNTQGCCEKSVNLGIVRQISLDCDNLDTLWCFRLNNIGKDELDIGGLGVNL